MAQPSYSDVFSIDHERGYEEEIQTGDLVSTGPNLFPYFKVIAVSGETAWVRDVQSGGDGLTALSRCRKVNGAPAFAI